VHYLTNSNRNILTVRKRFDERFYNYLDGLNTSLFDVKETKICLCYYNRTRKYINKIWNDKLKTDDSVLIKDDVKDEYTQDMYIYEELPVIARKTVQPGEVCMNNEAFEELHYDRNKNYLGTKRPNDDGEPEDHTIDIEFKAFMEHSA
jgi:hypothetical protein